MSCFDVVAVAAAVDDCMGAVVLFFFVSPESI